MGTEADDYGKKVEDSIRLLIEGESVRKKHPRQSNVTICMVPDSLRNHNPTAYTPRIVSIGPLHKEEPHLRVIEEHKVTYMYELFSGTAGSTMDIEEITCRCVHAVIGILTPARACYGPSLTNYEDSKLAEMMVIDGCFILGLLYRFNYRIKEDDPYFNNILVLGDIQHDLLLLENQIPFFILEILFSITLKQISNWTSLTDLVFCFFQNMNFINNSELITRDTVELCHILGNCDRRDTVEPCHILGLLQSCYRPRATTERGLVPRNLYSATKIVVAGVNFKAQRDEDSLLAVKFKQSPVFTRMGVLNIPKLFIQDSTPSFLRNLIAYEQCYPLSRQYVTSFAFLMQTLIDTNYDVWLLVRSNVLQHDLGAIQDVTDLFNDICKGVVLRDFYYAEELEQLDAYCDNYWTSILISCIYVLVSSGQSLRRLYRSTTWKTLTVIGAMMLFTLTLVQTIYTVKYA